ALGLVVGAMQTGSIDTTVGSVKPRLHVILDEDLTGLPAGALAFTGGCTVGIDATHPGNDFDQQKALHFGSPTDSPDLKSMKSTFFRYGILNNSGMQPLANGNGTEAPFGCGELQGDDLAFGIRRTTGNVVDPDATGGVLLHELGHTMNLQHGG